MTNREITQASFDRGVVRRELTDAAAALIRAIERSPASWHVHVSADDAHAIATSYLELLEVLQPFVLPPSPEFNSALPISHVA